MCQKHLTDRRRFLTATAACLTFGLTGNHRVSAAQARSKYFKNITWSFADTAQDHVTKNRYNPPLSFTKSDGQRIYDSMLVVWDRLHNPTMLDSTFRNYKKWFVKGVTTRQVKDWKSATFDDFVKTQFLALWDAQGVRKIEFSPWQPMRREDEGFAGWAQAAEIVKAFEKPANDGFSLVPIKHFEGDFKIQLSLRELRAPDFNPDAMAGVIAHEMLHKLGHAHNDGYKDNNFITVFGDTLALNGGYSDRSRPGLGLVNGIRLLTPG